MRVCMCSATCECVRFRTVANPAQLPVTPQMQSACISATVARFFLRVKVILVRVFAKFRGQPPQLTLVISALNTAHQPRQVYPQYRRPSSLCLWGPVKGRASGVK